MAELQTRLALDERREEERGKEFFSLKQKLTEAETTRDSLKKEVRTEESERQVLVGQNFSFFFFSNAAFYGSEAPGGV